MTAAVFALGLWIWSEYFRGIPHLGQQGVLKNFNVVVIEPHQAKYRVIDRRYYSPMRRTIHAASPVVDSFNDLAYVSNIDVLLTRQSLSTVELKKAKFDQERRCYQILSDGLTTAEQQKIQENTLNLSVIATSESAADQIRRLKGGQSILLSGAWVEVKYAKNAHNFIVGFGSPLSGNCRLFQVDDIQVLN